MYIVNLMIDENLVSQNRSYLTMHRTLIEAARLIRGIPQAECTIRKDGRMVAWLHTNHRGELDECEVWSTVSGLITPISPTWAAFAQL
jgi:hypothetical protein